MRLPRFRFTVRRMMVLVAMIAIVLGSWVGIERRRERFGRLARHHIHQIIGLGVGFGPPTGLGLLGWDHGGRRLTDEERARDRWHMALYLKYEEAASRPWLPVAPDPPKPR